MLLNQFLIYKATNNILGNLSEIDLAFFKEVSSQEAKDFLIQYYVTKPILNI